MSKEWCRVTVQRFKWDRFKTNLVVVGALALGTTAASADTVVLANGDRLTGQVQLLDAGTLVLKTEYAGEVRIKWDQVARLETQDSLLLRAPGLPRDFQARLAPAGQAGRAVAIRAEDAPPHPSAAPAQTAQAEVTAPSEIELAQMQRIVRPHPFLSTWLFKGGLDVALDATHASSRNQNWSAAANLSARRDMWRHGLRLNYQRKTQDSVVGTNNYAAAYTVDRFLSPKLFIQGRVRFERDHIEDPSKQFIAGLGPGYQFWDDELGSLSVSGLLTHTRYTYRDETQDHFQSLGMSWAYQRYFSGKQWQLFSNGEVYRGLRGGSNYNIDAELGVRYSMTQWMSLYAKTSYNGVALSGQSTTRETRYSLGLGVTW